MNTLRKLFIYLLIVLLISVSFQSILILILRFSKSTSSTLTQKFQNNFISNSKDVLQVKNNKQDVEKIFQTLSNLVTTIKNNHSNDGELKNNFTVDIDKLIVPIKRFTQIENIKVENLNINNKANSVNNQAINTAITNSNVSNVSNLNDKASKNVNNNQSNDENNKDVISIPYGKKIIFHTLSRGEKLSDLAKLYSVSVDSIKKINGFKDNYRLFVGQKIMIILNDDIKPKVLTNDKIENKIEVENKDKNIQVSGNIFEKKLKSENINGNSNNNDENISIDSILRSLNSKNNLKNNENKIKKQNDAKDKDDPLTEIIKNAKNKRRVFNWPVRGSITSPFGIRVHPVYGRPIMHTGIDIAANKGVKVRPAMGGVVTFTGWASGYGKMVEIKHPRGYITRYAHLSSIKVKPGQNVNLSTVIGLVGDTGTATGYHLHFEVRKNNRLINPMMLLKN